MKKWKYLRFFFLLAAIAYYFCLPEPLFDDPYSTVLEDRTGKLLSASIAPDGQWRFPMTESVPDNFARALVQFEDKRFYYHPGIDPLSMGRALYQNINAGRVVSGGSTISMQVIRLVRKGKPRTVWEKVVEMVLVTRLELRYSKDEILSLYAAHAPFGGNVVGLEAACWRYFGREPENLSWGEATMLAVLPNAPALIHPGRNREQLKVKRNLLLEKLYGNGKIDSLMCILAKEEAIPEEPKSLPRYARHLLTRAHNEGNARQRICTTVDLPLQERVEKILTDHHQRLKANHIFNAAAVVLDVETGEVLVYAGNTRVEGDYHGDEVDVVIAPRSTGSILKPFLFAAMLDEGKILPRTLLPDIPTIISGYSPKNFSNDYDGAVRASMALIRSLNVPAIHMLREYRYEKFHSLLRNMGMTTLTKPPDHYGLSLILGGAEGTLWDIAGMYASMARTLNHYFEHPGKNKYDKRDYFSPSYTTRQKSGAKQLEEHTWLSASAIYQTFDILKEVYRPGEESGWRYFTSSKRIAWKTGTSFGFRDGWAIGVTPDHVVGVWVGNASGEGRPGLTGTDAAAPIMLEIFSQLPGNRWFQRPALEMSKIRVCSRSGMRAGEWCEKADTAWVTLSGLQTAPCAYHKKISVTADKQFRVHSGCEAVSSITMERWFVLPPVQEYYFRPKNISYKVLPPFRAGCQPGTMVTGMDLVYPKPNAQIYVPRELDGHLGSAIFELAHRNPGATVYWHIDGTFVGATTNRHHLAIQPDFGKHILTLVDNSGEVLEQGFQVISNR